MAQGEHRPDARAPLAAGKERLAATAPRKVDNETEAQLLALLKIEADAREAPTPADLALIAANETRKLVRARQVFVMEGDPRSGFKVAAISSLSTVDRGAPLVQSVERVIARLVGEADPGKVQEFSPAALAGKDDQTAASYPFAAMIWVPYRHRGSQVSGGLVLARESEWQERDVVIARRLAGTYAHAALALSPQRPLGARIALSLSPGRLGRKGVAATAVMLAGLLLIPVPMTTLAPLEISARAPFVVTASIDGVIDDILVEPNAPVAAGQEIARLSDTSLRNRLEVAEREVMVAGARLKKMSQLAFADIKGRHEIAIARAELALKSAERDYARDLLAKAIVKADRAGIAVFADKKDLVGRPVATGERIMEIADPAHVELAIDIPVGDAIVLKAGARVKAFLDADPLRPLAGAVTRADYQARVRENNALAYRVVARLDASTSTPPRLGTRGTAQVYGETVSLGFYLLRRPIAAVRQWTGL